MCSKQYKAKDLKVINGQAVFVVLLFITDNINMFHISDKCKTNAQSHRRYVPNNNKIVQKSGVN